MRSESSNTAERAMDASPNVIVCGSSDDASLRAAEIFAEAIRSNPKITLGLATGGTPVAMYHQLVRMHRESGLDFSAVTTFNLDEYVGLSPDHPQSYRAFMAEHLFDHVNLNPTQTHLPNAMAENLSEQGAIYESRIEDAGGIDLQLLGIGHNGHIAFNEPGSPPDSRTRLVDLTERTIKSNARFFDSIDEVPRQAITMGVGTILNAKRILMLAIGGDKAASVNRAINGSVDPSHPASFLQSHSDVTCVLDEAAAGELT